MNITTFGYALILIIPTIIFLIWRVYFRDKETQTGPSDEDLDNALRNGFMLQELTTVEDTLKGYIEFLQSRMPITLPEVQQEIKDIKLRIRYVRNLKVLLMERLSIDHIGEDDWADMLKEASMLSSIMIPNKPKTQKEVDQIAYDMYNHIEELKKDNYLPKDYPNPRPTISIDEDNE